MCNSCCNLHFNYFIIYAINGFAHKLKYKVVVSSYKHLQHYFYILLYGDYLMESIDIFRDLPCTLLHVDIKPINDFIFFNGFCTTRLASKCMPDNKQLSLLMVYYNRDTVLSTQHIFRCSDRLKHHKNPTLLESNIIWM